MNWNPEDLAAKRERSRASQHVKGRLHPHHLPKIKAMREAGKTFREIGKYFLTTGNNAKNYWYKYRHLLNA